MDNKSIKTLKLIVVINLASLSFLILRCMNFFGVNIFISLVVALMICTKLSKELEMYLVNKLGERYKNCNAKGSMIFSVVMNILFFSYFIYMKEYIFLGIILLYYLFLTVLMKWWEAHYD